MIMRRFVYHVEYRLYQFGKVLGIDVIANSKQDAYVEATFVKIPALHKVSPYSAWVASVTYNNGKHHVFNTFEGMPY